MITIPTKRTDGDVAVGRNVAIGGGANIQGSARVGHNLRVEGWLDAPNIKGPLKGLFASEGALREAFPRGMPGWYALVGNTLPAAVWRWEDGSWRPAGESGGGEFAVQLTPIEGRLDAAEETLAGHDTLIGDLQDCASEHGDSLRDHESRLGAAERLGADLDRRLTAAEGTVTEHGTRLTAAEEALETQDTLIGDLQESASEHGGRLTAAEEALESAENAILQNRQAISGHTLRLNGHDTRLEDLETKEIFVRVESEEAMEALAASGGMEEGKLYYTVED